MLRMSTAEYLCAVSGCRRTRKFIFLDLPKTLRLRIYEYLWLGNTVNVCSWLKSHEGEYAEDDKCQLLLTCRDIRKEASGWYYFLSRWRFNSISSFQYFTWPDPGFAQRLNNITKVTLSKSEIFDEFTRHLHKFNKLQRLTIDVPHQFRVRTTRRAIGKDEQEQFVSSLIARSFYAAYLRPYLYIDRPWDASVVIELTYECGISEIVLVNLDECTLVFNYYPFPAKEVLYCQSMPCSNDDDVACTITHAN